MAYSKSSNNKFASTHNDLTFVPKVVSGVAGVFLGYVIANFVGII